MEDTQEKIPFSSFKPIPEGTVIETITEEVEESPENDDPTPEPVVEKNDTPEPTSSPEPTPEPETPTLVTPAPVEKDWKQVLEEHKNDILSELGFDEFILEMADYYKANGNVEPYLNAKAVDYSKISDDDMIAMGVKAQHPNAAENVINRLVAKELEKYKSDPDVDDPAEVELIQYEKQQAANKIRQGLVDEQKKFQLKTKVVAQPEDTTEDDKKAQEFNDKVTQSPETKTLLENKRIEIGGGQVNFEVSNPQQVIDQITGKENFYTQFFDGDNFNQKKWIAVASFAQNMDAYDKTLIDYGKSLALKAELEKDQNPGERQQTPAPEKQLTPFQTLQSQGRVTQF